MSEHDIEKVEPPASRGDDEIPLAVPVTRGDKITIHYPDDADVSTRADPEVWHFGGFQQDGVKLVRPNAFESALHDDQVVYGKTVEGVWRFNDRLVNKAERVEVEHVEIPDYFYVR